MKMWIFCRSQGVMKDLTEELLGRLSSEKDKTERAIYVQTCGRIFDENTIVGFVDFNEGIQKPLVDFCMLSRNVILEMNMDNEID